MAIAGNKLVNLAGAKVLYDDLRARIEALEADIATEDSATATAAHAVGDIILVGGALYSVTASIAIGDTITAEGNSANVTATTVAAVIAAAVSEIELTDLIDDTAGDGDTDKVYSADKVHDLLAALPAPSSIIDDTAGDGTTNKTWSADKIHDELAGKASSGDIPDTSTLLPKQDPGFTGKLSRGRMSDSKEGNNSVVIGNNAVAEGSYGLAIGNCVESYGAGEIAIGYYNKPQPVTLWTSNKEYAVGDLTRVMTREAGYVRYYTVKRCIEAHVSNSSNFQLDSAKWENAMPESTKQYYSLLLESIGCGTTGARENARELDVNGNETIKGNLIAKGGNITVGSTTMTEANLQALLAMLN